MADAAMALSETARLMCDEIAAVFEKMPDPSCHERLAKEIAAASRVVLYGVGREGLMMKALAMRLYHLGLQAHVVGDMSCPPVGPGDLLFVSAGPGYFSTVMALAELARREGARCACITAQPTGQVPTSAADVVIVLPAQTMADDTQGDNAHGGATAAAGQTTEKKLSVLPMGSLYEGAMYVFFEVLMQGLQRLTKTSTESMRARHTNLE
eukprot:jgi/Mesvir1/26476/Mv16146-RA.1